ncbi:hypothetical protein D3C85_887830 [compost metagenome]
MRRSIRAAKAPTTSISAPPIASSTPAWAQNLWLMSSIYVPVPISQSHGANFTTAYIFATGSGTPGRVPSACTRPMRLAARATR